MGFPGGSVKLLTLDLSSGLDVRIVSSSPALGSAPDVEPYIQKTKNKNKTKLGVSHLHLHHYLRQVDKNPRL